MSSIQSENATNTNDINNTQVSKNIKDTPCPSHAWKDVSDIEKIEEDFTENTKIVRKEMLHMLFKKIPFFMKVQIDFLTDIVYDMLRSYKTLFLYKIGYPKKLSFKRYTNRHQDMVIYEFMVVGSSKYKIDIYTLNINKRYDLYQFEAEYLDGERPTQESMIKNSCPFGFRFNDVIYVNNHKKELYKLETVKEKKEGKFTVYECIPRFIRKTDKDRFDYCYNYNKSRTTVCVYGNLIITVLIYKDVNTTQEVSRSNEANTTSEVSRSNEASTTQEVGQNTETLYIYSQYIDEYIENKNIAYDIYQIHGLELYSKNYSPFLEIIYGKMFIYINFIYCTYLIILNMENEPKVQKVKIFKTKHSLSKNTFTYYDTAGEKYVIDLDGQIRYKFVTDYVMPKNKIKFFKNYKYVTYVDGNYVYLNIDNKEYCLKLI